MRSFDLDIKQVSAYPPDEFCYLPEKLLIKELGITEDYENIMLLVQTISNKPSLNPLVTNHVNIDQTEITIPLVMYKSLFTEDGSINNEAANAFLSGFYVELKPAADIVISQDNNLISEPTSEA